MAKIYQFPLSPIMEEFLATEQYETYFDFEEDLYRAQNWQKKESRLKRFVRKLFCS